MHSLYSAIRKCLNGVCLPLSLSVSDWCTDPRVCKAVMVVLCGAEASFLAHTTAARRSWTVVNQTLVFPAPFPAPAAHRSAQSSLKAQEG
jgi:hypothetical protein